MEKFNNDSLLNRREAARFLGVKEITLAIWKSTNRYKLPVVMVGRLPKYRYGDLLEFIERQTVNKEDVANDNLSLPLRGVRHQKD